MSFNSYTDSESLQLVLESHVDKRAGRSFGPPPGKSLIYFMDDLNMPYLDKYNTQSPICLIRQIIDYGLVYNRSQLEEKIFLVDIMFSACMNPKQGSFEVDLRLTRHLTLFALATPEKEILNTIYHQILENHLQNFDANSQKLTSKIVNATQIVFMNMATNAQFKATAAKFHYAFNLRDFSKVIQNVMLAPAAHYKNDPLKLVRLWYHECMRVWDDRLIFEADREAFKGFVATAMKEFSDIKPELITEEPNIYTQFVASAEGHEAVYMPIRDLDHLNGVLEKKLAEYNETISVMDLVLFQQAMEHVSRICRII